MSILIKFKLLMNFVEKTYKLQANKQGFTVLQKILAYYFLLDAL